PGLERRVPVRGKRGSHDPVEALHETGRWGAGIARRARIAIVARVGIVRERAAGQDIAVISRARVAVIAHDGRAVTGPGNASVADRARRPVIAVVRVVDEYASDGGIAT